MQKIEEKKMAVSKLDLAKYPLPAFLEGRCTPSFYYKWLHQKADSLLKRDKKRRKPYALNAAKSEYKARIHEAVTSSGRIDPYTGDVLAWELIRVWDTSHDQPEGYKRKFALLPTVDHITPDVLKFEICSWQVNDSKAGLLPSEFIDLCRKVINYRTKLKKKRKLQKSSI
ncbi:MAG: hypothetical protein C0404_10620 [Verrucomicrobia bacterium]|nr:hypothetical protein [Verrucomicrobiota bacterium]